MDRLATKIEYEGIKGRKKSEELDKSEVKKPNINDFLTHARKPKEIEEKKEEIKSEDPVIKEENFKSEESQPEPNLTKSQGTILNANLELEQSENHGFVNTFLDSLSDLPKKTT